MITVRVACWAPHTQNEPPRPASPRYPLQIGRLLPHLAPGPIARRGSKSSSWPGTSADGVHKGAHKQRPPYGQEAARGTARRAIRFKVCSLCLATSTADRLVTARASGCVDVLPKLARALADSCGGASRGLASPGCSWCAGRRKDAAERDGRLRQGDPEEAEAVISANGGGGWSEAQVASVGGALRRDPLRSPGRALPGRPRPIRALCPTRLSVLLPIPEAGPRPLNIPRPPPDVSRASPSPPRLAPSIFPLPSQLRTPWLTGNLPRRSPSTPVRTLPRLEPPRSDTLLTPLSSASSRLPQVYALPCRALLVSHPLSASSPYTFTRL